MDIPRIIAHRGASGTAPENTLAAIYRAKDLGASAIEMDATISSDGVAVMLHDEYVDRCSDGSGPIAQKTIDEIRKLDGGSWFGEEFAGEPIPTLSQAMAAIIRCGLFFNLEIKPSPGREEETAKIVAADVIENWQTHIPLLVSSSSEICLQTFQPIVPDVPCGLIVDRVPKNWRHVLERNNCISIHLHHLSANPEIVAEIGSAGYRALAYTVDEPEIARQLFAMGIDGIFTNFPERIMPVT